MRRSRYILLAITAFFAVPTALAVVSPHVHHPRKPTFAITGKARRLLLPGAKAATIRLTLRNPASHPIFVTRVRVTLRAVGFRRGCNRSAFRIKQPVLPRRGVRVPAAGRVTLPTHGVKAPTIRMLSAGNQDRCRGLKLTLRYTGRAHS